MTQHQFITTLPWHFWSFWCFSSLAQVSIYTDLQLLNNEFSYQNSENFSHLFSLFWINKVEINIEITLLSIFPQKIVCQRITVSTSYVVYKIQLAMKGKANVGINAEKRLYCNSLRSNSHFAPSLSLKFWSYYKNISSKFS